MNEIKKPTPCPLLALSDKELLDIVRDYLNEVYPKDEVSNDK